MRSSQRAAPAAMLSCTLVLAAACIQIPATNPFDEDAPPDLQAKATLSGHASYPSIGGEPPEPPEGIVVEALRVGIDEPVKSVVTSAANGGRFDLEVPGGTYLVRASAGLYAPALFGPVRVAPGGAVDVGALTLNLGAATASLAGQVSTSGGLSAAGIQVQLKYRTASGACGGTEAETTTDAAGGFSFEAVRPGRYAVIARTEGATVDVGDVEVEDSAEITLAQPLRLQPGTGVIQLESDGARPTETTRLPSVTVHVVPFAGMEEMQLGLDPTFDPAYGATGWQPFSEQRVFDLVDVQDQHTVYVQLRSSCAVSPLYGARVVYDKEPPEVLSTQVAGQEVLLADEEDPVVVIGDNRTTVSVTLNTLDLSGVAEVHLSLVSEDASSSQVEQVETLPGQAIVRVEANLPDAEGEYLLGMSVVDRAGNATALEKSPKARVLRDFSAPTTPVPLVDRLEVFGPRALIWLAERPCDGQSEPSVICETNLHPEGSFLVRGGALIDYTPAATNPIEVEVPDGESLIEIVARDAGGTLSPGVARVEVTRVASRTLFTAPEDKELGAQLLPTVRTNVGPLDEFVVSAPTPPDAFTDRKQLVATNGTAFFSLRPRTGLVDRSYYSYLIAQPADTSSVGLSSNLSPLPKAIRKLSIGCPLLCYPGEDCFIDCEDTHARPVGGLGGGAGALTWLERFGLYYGSSTRPYRHVLFPDENARYDLRGPEYNDAVADYDGELAPHPANHDTCIQRGLVRCSEEPLAWAPYHQTPPAESVFDGRQMLTAGAGQRRDRIAGAASGVLEVTGPHIVAAVLEPERFSDAHGTTLIGGVVMDIEVPAGTLLHTAVYWPNGLNPTAWALEIDQYNNERDMVVNVATGAGKELLLAPKDTFSPASAAADAPLAIGVLVPAGVTARIPLETLPAAGNRWTAVGLLDRAVTEATRFADLSWIGGARVDDDTAVPIVDLIEADRDPANRGTVSGLSLRDFGADGQPSSMGVPSQRFDPSLADERVGFLAREDPRIFSISTAAPDALEVREAACSLIIKPRADVLVRDIRVRGQGELDALSGSLYANEGASPLGVYRTANLNPESGFIDTVLSFRSPDDESCGDLETLERSVAASVTAQVTEVSSDVQDVSAQAVDVIFEQAYAGLAADGELVNIELAPPSLGLPVSPGTRLKVTLTADPADGDGDLHVRFDDSPTEDAYDCRPYDFGSDEECELTVPAGTTHAYVAVHAYPDYGDVDYELTVQVLQPVREIGSFPVTPGDFVTVTTTGTQGDADLYVRFGAAPTLSEYDCASRRTGNEESCVLAVPAGASAVYVAAHHYSVPVDYTVTVAVRQPAPAEVATLDVDPGQTLRVTLVSDEPALALVRYDDEPGWRPLACDADAAPVVCEGVVSAGAVAHVAAISTGQTAPVEAVTELLTTGCTEVVAAGFNLTRSESTGVLRAGVHYLLVLGGPWYGDPLGWPEESPAVFTGAAEPSGYFDVLGTVPELTPFEDELVVSSIDGAGPRCRVEIDVVQRARYERLSLDQGVAAAAHVEQLPDGRLSTRIEVGLTGDVSVENDDVALVAHTLPAGWSALATHVEGGRLYWLEVDEEHLRPTVWSKPLDAWPPTGEPCEVISLGGEFQADVAAFAPGRLVVGGTAVGRQVIDVYDLDTQGGCPSAHRSLRRALPGTPVAAALTASDLFVWHEEGSTGGRLLHVDLRDVGPLHPAGSKRLAGFDAGDELLVAVLAESDDPLQMKTLALEVDPERGSLSSTRVLSTGGPRLHPRLVGGALAEIRPGSPGPLGAQRPVIALTSLVESGPAVVVSQSAAAFAGAPAFDPSAPLAWATTPMLESDGAHLAVLGHDASGRRRLLLWEVPGDPSAWQGLAPALDVPLTDEDVDPEVERLFVSDGVAGVTFTGQEETALLFSRDESGAWAPVPTPPRSEARVLGAVDGKVLLLENPGLLFVPKPPVHAALWLRDAADLAADSASDAGTPDAGAPDEQGELVGRVPAGVYLHALGFAGRGPTGEILLFDEGAEPAVLWRVDARTGFAVADEGPHRPLTRGAGSVGVTARPRSSGEALYFLRRIDSGIALMRYRPLMP